MRACPACENSIGLTHLWKTRIIRCPNCGLAYNEELPSFQDLEEIYSDEHYFQGGFYSDYVTDKKSTQLNFRQRINVLRKFSNDGNLFEVGCAHGFFLELAEDYWTVQGIDKSPKAVEYARDVLTLNVQLGDFESHPPQESHFNVITMWDVIEHLYDPVLAIRKSTEALRPGGILALTTGDIDAFLPRLQKQAWRLIIPQHLYYFSKKSLTWLFENYDLELVHCSHVSYYRSLQQMSRVLTWHHQNSSFRRNLVQQIEKLPFINLRVPLNLFDIIFMIARKPGNNIL